MKKKIAIIGIVALVLLLASCSPSPSKGKSLNVPSWLQGTWRVESTPTLSINATSSNIVINTGASVLSLDSQLALGCQEISSGNSYQIAMNGNGYYFEKMPDGSLKLTIMTAGIGSVFYYTK